MENTYDKILKENENDAATRNKIKFALTFRFGRLHFLSTVY